MKISLVLLGSLGGGTCNSSGEDDTFYKFEQIGSQSITGAFFRRIKEFGLLLILFRGEIARLKKNRWQRFYSNSIRVWHLPFLLNETTLRVV